ncbi:MAG: DUF2851 family protein [Balneolaceae bacterium]
MAQHKFPYKESLLQWIWQYLEFSVKNLRTNCGKSVSIVNHGTINKGAGPDFLGAHIVVNGVSLHGSVEIHTSESHWNDHRHQHDPAFNTVVLHVVYSKSSASQTILRKDGTRPLTVQLKPYLHKSLQTLLQSSKKDVGLPCRGDVRFINQAAFEKQIQQAHIEYFNYKVEEILKTYDASQSASKAWLQCLIHSSYRATGISQNTQPMHQLFKMVIEKELKSKNIEQFVRSIETIAFAPKNAPYLDWTHSGIRPSSYPENRVQQAAALHFALLQFPFKKMLLTGTPVWEPIFKSIPDALQPGAQMKSLIYNTVFLPSIYLLGDLFCSKKLKEDALSKWGSFPQKVPQTIQKPFRESGFDISGQAKRLGLAHQLKRYCNELECHRCEIFKNAISS